MKHDPETFEWILRYVDDDLSPEERQRADELLRTDPVARGVLRDVALHAVVVADIERVEDVSRTDARFQSVSPQRKTWLRTVMVAVAAALVLAFIGQAWVFSDDDSIVTVVGVNGPVQWIGDGGRVTDRLNQGQQLTGGTLELASAASWVEFQFHDGSSVVLSGRSALTVSEGSGRKELRLRHGQLSASVLPQQPDRPMVVFTEAAELRVLGTQFNVDAESEATKLTVNEGKVRLVRLGDGQPVIVPAEHEVTASIDDTEELTLSRRPSGVMAWSSDLQADIVQGKWLSRLWVLSATLKSAVARGDMTKAAAVKQYKAAATLEDDRGSVWAMPSPVGALVVLSPARSLGASVLLTDKAKLRIRGLLHTQTEVQFGLSTVHPDGGFAGKFGVTFDANTLRHDDRGFSVEISVEEFVDISGENASPVGKELSDWWSLAVHPSAKLEITEVELRND